MKREEWRNRAARGPVAFSEALITVYAQSAKSYWRWWGPLGEPMIFGIEVWANAQRRYLECLREAFEGEDRQLPRAFYKRGIEKEPDKHRPEGSFTDVSRRR